MVKVHPRLSADFVLNPVFDTRKTSQPVAGAADLIPAQPQAKEAMGGFRNEAMLGPGRSSGHRDRSATKEKTCTPDTSGTSGETLLEGFNQDFKAAARSAGASGTVR